MINLLFLILKTIGVIIAAWMSVHILAVFGLFLAVAWPAWWLLTPAKTFCLFCRALEKGRRCPVCKRVKGEIIQPRSFSAALANGAVILAFSLISVAIVFGENWFLTRSGIQLTKRTVVFNIPDKGQYRLGEIFPMKIEIVGIEKPINAVQADIGFNPDHLEVIKVSTEESFASVFIQEEINNDGGYVRLTGGLPSPGFFSNQGVFGTILFRGKAPGITQVKFLPSSMVLANDGRGSNVIKELAQASYLILPEKISEKEELLQNELLAQKVLGEQASSQEQLKFYPGDSILGAWTKKELEEKTAVNSGEVLGTKAGIWERLLQLNSRYDEIVVNLWKKILRLESFR